MTVPKSVRRTILLGMCGFLLLCPDAFAADEKIELHVWGMNLGESRFGWYAIVDAFEAKYPNVRIVIGPTDRSQDLQKLLSGIIGDSPPDVFRRESQLFGDIAARGIIMPLDVFLEADKDQTDGLHEEDYLPGEWQSGVIDGQVYGICESSNPNVMAYNRNLFRNAGLDPDRPPRTWDEWVEATEKLTIRDERGRITQLGTVFGVRDDLSFYIAQQGANVFSDDARECLLDSPEGVAALRLHQDLYEAQGGHKAYSQFAASHLVPEEFDPFATGKIAMSVEDDWVIFRGMRFGSGNDLGIAPVPVPAGRTPITTSPTNTLYMIPVNARRPKEAWDYIRFISSPEGELTRANALAEYARSKGRQHQYTGFRPNQKTMAALSEKYAPRESPFREAFESCGEILKTLVPVQTSPVSGVLRDEMLRARDRVAVGQMTPEEAIRDADQRVQEQLDLFYSREELPLFDWRYVWVALALLVASAVGFLVHRTRGERAYGNLQRYENRMGLVFISPWVCGLLLFIAGPMVFSIAMSLCDYDVIHPARFVGFRNYVWLLTRDPLFWKSLRNTAFMVVALPIGMAASLGIALLLNVNVKGMSWYRTIFYLPAITPMVAASVLWYALLNPDGLINAGLNATIGEWFGVSAPAWLGDENWSKPALILMGLWTAGGGMILWLAGLQGIPLQLYEAASIDGAGVFRRFRSITLPMLTPYIFFSFVVGVIGVFQIFAQALILTLGGPADSTLFYVYYLFNNAFRYFRMGYASAQAWILFAIMLVLTLLQWRLAKKWVHYG